jgi:hypothetical protein
MDRSFSLSLALILLMVSLAAGCDTSNTVAGLNFNPQLSSATYDPATRVLTVKVSDRDGDDLTVGVTVPAALAVDHAQQVVTGGVGSAHFIWKAADHTAGGSGEVTISVTDDKVSAPITRNITITVPAGNAAPTIDSVSYLESYLTVAVDDADGDDVTVAVTVPEGLAVDSTSRVVAGGHGTAQFVWSTAGTWVGETTISVSDGAAQPVTTTQQITLVLPLPPVIHYASWGDSGDGSGTLTVDISSLFMLDTVLSVTVPAGTSVDAAQQMFSGVGTAEAVFTFTETTPGSGASGEVTITATTANGSTTKNVQLTIAPHIIIAPWPLDPDTLYARSLKSTVAVGEAVTIHVYTGQPAHPLQFLSSVGFTVETAGTYIASSFNIGSAGGTRTQTDGYWSLLTPAIADDYYLDLPSHNPGAPTDIGGGFHRYSFAVVPMGAYAAPASIGAGNGPLLFSFQLSFSQPGTYHLGFQLNDGTHDQTYYSDADQNKYYWSVLDGSNTITVQ